MDADRVLAEVLRIRFWAWPDLRILERGERLLGRGGALPRAAAALYRHELEARPHLADEFRRHNRGREVDAAEALAAG